MFLRGGRLPTNEGTVLTFFINSESQLDGDLVEEVRTDYITFDILKKYYQDEKEDMFWCEVQLELIECIGVQNWFLQQM